MITNKNLHIIGAGGHSRSFINLLEINNYSILGIYDEGYDSNVKEIINGYEIKGGINAIPREYILALAIGDNFKREDFFLRYKNQILNENIIHPKATIEKNTEVGCYNQIFSNIYINSNAKIGVNNILNTGSIIEHEVNIGNHNHISVNSVLCGRVKIGNRCFVGAGAVIIDKIKICDDVVVGANSVVIKDISSPGTYVGNPARRVK